MDAELDEALAASLAWKEAEDARQRRRASLREGDDDNDDDVVVTCEFCGQPLLRAWSVVCGACGGAVCEVRGFASVPGDAVASGDATGDARGDARDPNGGASSTSCGGASEADDAALARALHASLNEADGSGDNGYIDYYVDCYDDSYDDGYDDDRRGQAPDGSLDAALATSLAGLWECAACNGLNAAAAHVCGTCGAFVTGAAAEAVAAESALDAATGGVERSMCGLPGCTRPAAGSSSSSSSSSSSDGGGSSTGGSGGGSGGAGTLCGFCCAAHQAKAEARGLLAPAHAHVEVAFVSPDGGWSAHVLTRRHSGRRAVVQQFHASWRKPHADCSGRMLRPRVQRVMALRCPPEVKYGWDGGGGTLCSCLSASAYLFLCLSILHRSHRNTLFFNDARTSTRVCVLGPVKLSATES